MVAAEIGKALLPPLEQVRQAKVIEAEQTQDCRVQVVDVDSIQGGAEAEFVGGADHLSALDPAAGQPGREAVGVVIAAGALVGIAAVGDRRATELAAPEEKKLSGIEKGSCHLFLQGF